MQAIARANRVAEGKNNGLIVDCCGILKNLRKALATFAGHTGVAGGDEQQPPELDPVKPKEKLLADLEEAIEARAFLEAQGFRLETVLEKTGFERNKAIIDAKEVVNQNDETRKRFEIICREVFKKFKACLTIKAINDYRSAYDAINIIYKSLQEDVKKADISHIMRELHSRHRSQHRTRPVGLKSLVSFTISAKSTLRGCDKNLNARPPRTPQYKASKRSSRKSC